MHYDEESKSGEPEAREGFFDAQLPLPGHFAGPVTPLDAVVKRSGRSETFNKAKIARAIMAAGQAGGGFDEDRAAHLAAAVAIHLTKRPDQSVLTVDDIHLAVERVLMHMGHCRTATAFVRFREKRDRIRALRAQRDPHARVDAQGIAAGDRGLQIQTSGETLDAWDRARIATALVRETGIPEATAADIARQVETQILSVGVHALTTPLVRELVTAKLIEQGLERYAHRHRRLGVPLFDTEAILAGSSRAHSSQSRDPEATDWMLAESVKKEYALGHVFSGDVAESHLLGDIHIHGLAMVDRLRSASHSLELIKRFGMDILGIGAVAGPPRAVDVLSAELAGVTMALQRHFYGPMAWRASNVFFAPFLEGMGDDELHAWAEMVLRDLAMSTAVNGRSMPPVRLELCWETPPALAEVEAIGPGGAYTGRSYKEYGYTSQKAANAMVRALCDLRRRGISLTSPIPSVRIGDGLLRDPGYHGILLNMAALAAANPRTEMVFDRSEPWLVGEDMPWRSREVGLHSVTLNLPRAAYRGGRDGIVTELERLMPLVAAAHAQKYRLLTRILDRGEAGPLALIGRMREGAAIHELEHAVCHVGVMGLNECVEACTGHALHESHEARQTAHDILGAARELCRFWSEQTGLTLMLTSTADPIPARRLAELDAEHFAAHAAQVIETETPLQEIAYSWGVECIQTAGMSPAERARLEGALHADLGDYPATRISIPDHDMSADAVAAFILKAYRQTAVQRLVFV